MVTGYRRRSFPPKRKPIDIILLDHKSNTNDDVQRSSLTLLFSSLWTSQSRRAKKIPALKWPVLVLKLLLLLFRSTGIQPPRCRFVSHTTSHSLSAPFSILFNKVRRQDRTLLLKQTSWTKAALWLSAWLEHPSPSSVAHLLVWRVPSWDLLPFGVPYPSYILKQFPTTTTTRRHRAL